VRRGGGAGKPATVYELAPGVEPLFSKAYLPLLVKLLETLADRMTTEELQDVMGDVGRRLAAGQVTPPADLGTRVEAAAALLTDLGGLNAVEEHDGRFVIRGYGCPLSAAVAQRPEVCLAVETLLSVVTGAEVREHCDRSARPQCAFHLGAPATRAR
jgi:predicted ArsR family transcriptional regulator